MLIDATQPARGCGRAAIAAVIGELRRRDPPPRELGLSYRPANRGAGELYASPGFRRSGTDEKRDAVAWLGLAEG